jgi:peroxiredoxin
MVRKVWFLVMACLAALAVGTAGVSALETGKKGPDFTLAGTDGKVYGLAAFKDAKAVVVAFTCNHCPVAQAYEARLIELAKSYKEKGVAVVAISSNDAKAYPADSFENMMKRAKGKKYPHPYLYDPDQTAARAYGATVTPHIFLLDGERKLVYAGAVDDNDNARRVKEHWLKDAIDQLLAGKKPQRAATKARGCSIKWKSKR